LLDGMASDASAGTSGARQAVRLRAARSRRSTARVCRPHHLGVLGHRPALRATPLRRPARAAAADGGVDVAQPRPGPDAPADDRHADASELAGVARRPDRAYAAVQLRAPVPE